jgi:transcriptional regulator with XRE-family HTH domain
MKPSLADRVRAERLRAGLSQKKLADMCDLTQTTISCIESGKTAGSEDSVVSVARALKVRTEWLKIGSGEKEAVTVEGSATLVRAYPPGAQVDPQSFADRIKRLRKDNGLTQQQLAALVGVSTSAIGNWETRPREIPKGDNLLKLAEVFGVSPLEFMKSDRKGSHTSPEEVLLLAAFRPLPKGLQLMGVSDILCKQGFIHS